MEQHLDSHAEALHLLRTREKNFSLPQPFYKDPAFYQLDLEHIWYKNWIFAGVSCDIPKPGDYFTLAIGEYPLIISRAKDGSIHAFHNTCRHRGSRICSKHRGNAPKLVCPYHQWTYEHDGKLLFAGQMGPDFDVSKYALKQAHCRTVGGYVFVCVADEAPDFEAFRATVEPYMLPHELEGAKVAHTSTLIEKANWKLVIENNRECYHCAGSHPELLRTISEFDATDDPRINPVFRQRIIDKAAQWDAQGLPNKAVYADNHRYRVVRLPLAHGESMTMDGKPAVKRLLGHLSDADLGSVRLLSLPNSWNHLQGDHALAFRVLPLGPETTMVTTFWLVHKDAVEDVDYDVANLAKVWEATNDQDRILAEENQVGIDSPAYEPGPYGTDIEFGVLNFIGWYTDALESELAGPQPSLKPVAA